MRNLKRLGIAVTLMFVFASATIAGETNTPPCVPGEMSTPPCASLTATDATTPGEIPSPPAAESFDVLALAETVLALVF